MTRLLLYLNGLAILMIPLQHASAYALQAMFQWTDRYMPVTVPNFDQLGTWQYHAMILVRQFSTFSVPAFLFISGFFIAFLARNQDSELSWKQVLPRMKVLLIPFIIWTVLRFVILRDIPKTVEDLLMPYHFVPLLFQFYLIAPILVILARKNWKLLLLLAAFFHMTIHAYNSMDRLGWMLPGQTFVLNYTPRWFFLGQQPFWFPLGVVFGLNMVAFTPKLRKSNKLFLFLTIFFLIFSITEYYVADYLNGPEWIGPNYAGLTRDLFILCTILYVISLDSKTVPFSQRFSDLGSKSLGIYLVNIPAIYIVAVFMYRFTPRVLGAQMVYLSILFLAGIILPLLLMGMVRHTPARVYYRYFFG